MDQPMANQAPRKSGGGALKWVLLGCGGLLLLVLAFFGISGYLVYRSFNTDPTKVEATAQEILVFEKPAGYKGAFSMSVMGVKMAALMADGGAGGSIVMITMPGKANQEQLRAQMRANMEKQGQSTEVVEKRKNDKFKVRGAETESTVEVIAAKNNNARMLQYMLPLDGKTGDSLLLVITGPEQTTDHAFVQKFLDSVK